MSQYATTSLFQPNELVAGLSHKYIIIISTTILYYEYGQTLAREVAYVWAAKPQITAINILFYLNRYLSLFAPVGFLLQAVWLSEDHPNKLELCTRLSSFHMYFSVLVQLIVGVFLVLRTYALYNGNRWVLGVLVISAAAVLANGIHSVSSGTAQVDEAHLLSLDGCNLPMNTDAARRQAEAWAGLLALDLLIFMLTLYKSIDEIRFGGSTIMRVLLRDGAIYFGIMAIFTSMTMVTLLVFGPYYRGFLVTLTNTLSSVMMSRLLFNLRDPSLCCRDRYVPGSTVISHHIDMIWTDAVSIEDEDRHTALCREGNRDSQWSVGRSTSHLG